MSKAEKHGARSNRAVLTATDIPIIRQQIGAGRSYQQIATRFGVGRQAIYTIAKGINWKHVL
ncbi:hypothetical protein Dfer_5497 [Dyadobacter fermentans DSM 18053]|uniref:Resolvase HTH domain-containing protein n=1 Tax=Dyadobacter fermentans (strain ATCC 700827 / DSM 18053 / CIP 107007 / KCTC 52180 / NS114) TaxID=471854 RepID=C6VVF8_DYAFD|nr:hypothetical protein Dfer_5497 [Dyadobacter fermentans DSM 18053]